MDLSAHNFKITISMSLLTGFEISIRITCDSFIITIHPSMDTGDTKTQYKLCFKVT